MSNYKSMIPSKRKADENDDAVPGMRSAPGRNPLGVLVADNVAYRQMQTAGSSKDETYWNVQWRKPQTKKHKTWDGDGVLIVAGTKMTLKDLDDKIISTGTISSRTGAIELGASFAVGGKDLEIDSAISKEEYLSGRCFTSSSIAYIPPPPPTPRFQMPKVIRPDIRVESKPPAALGSMPQRKPSMVVAKAPEPKSMDHPTDSDYKSIRYYTVNWRKPQTKKFKTWDGDAYLIVTGSRCVMQDAGGRSMGTTTWSQTWLEGGTIHIANKEVEIDGLITEAEFRQQCSGVPPPDPEIPLRTTSVIKFQPAIPKAGYSRTSTNSMAEREDACHDPETEFYLPRPTVGHQAKAGKSDCIIEDVYVEQCLANKLRPHQKEGVIFLYEAVMGMRRHEGTGAILADEMGLGKTLQTIALLMTLLRQSPYRPPNTPLHAKTKEIGKAIIVCPVSLVANWRNEIWKWLGRDRLGVFVAEETKNIKLFNHSRSHDVLIIGYEKLRSVIETLAYCNPKIDLIICDEGHRLKSVNNKTSKMFDALKTKRRVILSGTPIQNDLSEFWAMADFCNPGLLGDYKSFKRIYEDPILRSRMPNCTEKNKELGTARSDQLATISKSFVLRRTADILTSYLPPKYEYVVFIRPTKLQFALMLSILNDKSINRFISSGMAQSLEMMNVLGKICTSPVLLKSTAKPESQRTQEIKDTIAILPRGIEESDSSTSGKLIALVNLLNNLRKTTDEKAIIVSQYTKTLDLIEAICIKMRWSRTRLDGSTPQDERDHRVTEFNKSEQEKCFVFLLSLKAGGVGLNLVGASRLILLDSSWNPANDLQAMARIHRDGQKKPVHIYRFLTAGTIDEKIYMRQVIKMGLSNSLMAADGDGKSKVDSFSPAELRDLFRIHPHTPSHTHDLLFCDCAGSHLKNEDDEDEGSGGQDDDDNDDGEVLNDSDDGAEPPPRGFMLASQVHESDINAKAKNKKRELAMLDEWTHINCMGSAGRQGIKDSLLRDVVCKAYDKAQSSNNEPVGGNESRVDKLLSQIDLEKIKDAVDSDDESVNKLTKMDEVAGGAVTFLFTKCSM
ncbi:hypothetical protein CALVIDRAFT_556302 [Calocera viscosa TUFC12733]|uniref:DNA repair and recombination protein RAD54B n=1 Tax=Calocera viscosa (strain TUFC12733) TaxID=1330018 RepID=A0A167KCL0_CALVF|nr:hypothetical protein CALVIDRAFT_556302 [Calocera viscosa TUFC12733]